jgi:hypothetical protein
MAIWAFGKVARIKFSISCASIAMEIPFLR